MTKVILTPSILEYRCAMAALVGEICEENAKDHRESIEDFGPAATEVVELWTPGLLRPPKIESLFLDLKLKKGHLDGLILISTSENFGVMNVYVTLEDEQGNRLEGGYALDNELVKNQWCYVPSASAHSGMTVIVRAVAMDRLGGVGIETERITVCCNAEQSAGSC
jgi:hypothetical protein